MGVLRNVVISITNEKTGEIYHHAKSYPHRFLEKNGQISYKTPVYKVFIFGNDSNGVEVRKEWKCLRFMPYWNHPDFPVSHYKAKGWLNSGLSKYRYITVTMYKRNYRSGAIVIEGGFYIHDGPSVLSQPGWGAAGCVEIVGNFEDFKNDIKLLSGSTKSSAHDAIEELVNAGRLDVEIEEETNPPYWHKPGITDEKGHRYP